MSSIKDVGGVLMAFATVLMFQIERLNFKNITPSNIIGDILSGDLLVLIELHRTGVQRCKMLLV